jgi:phosphopentomutase
MNEAEHYRKALELIAEQQPRALDKLRAHGIVFADIGNDPSNWQHVAFSLYTDLCEVDAIARGALP